tara:strand:- start:850 stop:1032 length:183 start_codon:yes stop_codon:yes gene_type:complete
MFDWIIQIIGIVTSVVCAASIIAAVTDTPKDDELLGKFYKAIELLALNIGKAKMLPPNKD